MIPSLEGWLTKAKEAPPLEVRLAPLDTNLVFQSFLPKILDKQITINKITK